jgi:protein-disulfide isomerase
MPWINPYGELIPCVIQQICPDPWKQYLTGSISIRGKTVMRAKWMSMPVILILMALSVISPAWGGEVELIGTARLQLSEHPKDVAVSMNGKWVFVLTDTNQLSVYTPDGKPSDTLKLDSAYDQIRVGPEENILYLVNAKDRVVDAVNLEFVRHIDISGSPVKGPSDAPVTIIVFSDFQCPYCSRLGSLFDQVMEKYPNKIKLVYKHFPLNSHPFAVKAAAASMAAMEQGKFWEYHDLLYQNMNHLSDETFISLAAELKLDKDAFNKRMNDQETFLKIREDWKDGTEVGVQGTPTVFVNGRLLRDRTIEALSAMVDKALKAK